ncbi:MAG: hypothetical protein CVU12_08970 [Bacteroidetes bacterium HGW-Bacteroidetes-7]|jgi:hypothetical protein|nr:MAG: hypothetical protein CVU12_08970 [Bacteroidetes bacterium HGW-Bacteroidetes-7]
MRREIFNGIRHSILPNQTGNSFSTLNTAAVTTATTAIAYGFNIRKLLTHSKRVVQSLITKLYVVFAITLLSIASVISSCQGLVFTDDDGDKGDKGETGSGTLAMKFGEAAITKGVTKEFPDSNSFTLVVKRVDGSVIYNGRYGDRPANMVLVAASYDVSVFSRPFGAPQFDAPCYSDSKTVVVEKDKVTYLQFLCRQSNGAVLLSFTPEFKSRFGLWSTVLSDAAGSVVYPYSESRYLYMNPGEISVRLKQSAVPGDSSGVLLTRRTLLPSEMVAINLHSSSGETGGGEGGAATKIVIDTSSIWVKESLVVGNLRDGSSKELALNPDELEGYSGLKGIWVCGYIAGYLTTGSLISIAPFDVETNIAIALIPGETLKSRCAGVALPTGPIRDALNLKAKPANLGKKIWVKGTIADSYFGIRGVNSLTEFALE